MGYRKLDDNYFDNEMFGRRLDRRREQLGWNINDMAMELGIVQSHASALCRGVRRAKPSVNLLCAICEKMHISADYLLGYSQSPYTKKDELADMIEEEVNRRYDVAKVAYSEIGLPIPDDLRDRIYEQVNEEMEVEE
jgi:transcriptional regulator with XRE-family HTH domain